MSTSYVIDSWAWMEYLKGTDIGEKVRVRIKGNKIFVSAVSITEVISKVHRDGMDADIAFEALTSLSKTIHINEINAREVGMLHAHIKKTNSNFSLGDAFVLHAARQMKAKILTGDPDFKGMIEAEMLK